MEKALNFEECQDRENFHQHASKQRNDTGILLSAVSPPIRTIHGRVS
jgi:hypothetical protein